MTIDEKIKSAIKPHDIPTTGWDWCDTFGKTEREISAAYVLQLSQRKGGWIPFTQAELDAMEPSGHFHWNGLDRPKWIQKNKGGTFEVTAAFIVRCLGLHREPNKEGL